MLAVELEVRPADAELGAVGMPPAALATDDHGRLPALTHLPSPVASHVRTTPVRDLAGVLDSNGSSATERHRPMARDRRLAHVVADGVQRQPEAQPGVGPVVAEHAPGLGPSSPRRTLAGLAAATGAGSRRARGPPARCPGRGRAASALGAAVQPGERPDRGQRRAGLEHRGPRRELAAQHAAQLDDAAALLELGASSPVDADRPGDDQLDGEAHAEQPDPIEQRLSRVAASGPPGSGMATKR